MGGRGKLRRVLVIYKAFLNSAVLVLGISMCCAPGFAISDDSDQQSSNGFFNQDAVTDMSIPLLQTEQVEMQYGPTKGFKLPEKKPELEKPQVAKQNSSASVIQKDQKQDVSEKAAAEGVDTQALKLKEEYGDPKEAVLPKGVDSAPKPYKAMLEAINMGRDDLALEYASAWIGYMDKLDQVVRKGAAMASVVRLDPANAAEDTPEDALTNIDPTALNSFFNKRKIEKEQSKAVSDIDLDQRAQLSIKGFFNDEAGINAANKPKGDIEADPYAKLFDSTMNPESRKLLIRSTLAGKLPSEPTGQVQALFFMRPSEQISVDIGKELAKVLASPTLGVSLKVVPLSVDGVSIQDNAEFTRKTGMPTLLRDGSALVQTLSIDKTPAIMFIASSSGKAFLKTGIADSVFIEEVANMIGGK